MWPCRVLLLLLQVRDLLLRIHSIFPDKPLLLQFIEACAAAATAAQEGPPRAPSEAPTLLARSLGAPIPAGLQQTLRETAAVAARSVS